MPRQIVLPRSWGLSIPEATRIAQAVGVTGIHFVSLTPRRPRSQALASSRRRQSRGGQFLALDRR